jgi:hypothetical protein
MNIARTNLAEPLARQSPIDEIHSGSDEIVESGDAGLGSLEELSDIPPKKGYVTEVRRMG